MIMIIIIIIKTIRTPHRVPPGLEVLSREVRQFGRRGLPRLCRAYTYIYIYIYIYIHTYIHTHTYTHIMYTYIHIHILWLRAPIPFVLISPVPNLLTSPVPSGCRQPC